MPVLNLQPVDVCNTMTRDTFQAHFLRPNKPVVMKDFSATCPAKERWTVAHFKRHYADINVPVYKEAFAATGKSYTSSDDQMRFGDYLDLISAGPTPYRMFLFNIFKKIPALCQDFDYPAIVDRYVKAYPFMFFGGATSFVDAHFDLDLSHVYLTQFHGKKRVILFGPEYSTHLYRHPLTVASNVDLGRPDFERYPVLSQAKGYECVIDAGDTLFIPSGYWHYIEYIEGGFALSLRSRPAAWSRRLLSAVKIVNLVVLDHQLAKILGHQRWYDMKENMAQRRANRLRR